MPLLRVKRHMAAISSRQAWRGLAQLHPLRQAGLPQWVDGAEEAVGERLALTAGAVFFEQQVTEPLFEAVDEFQHRVAGQIGPRRVCCSGVRWWRWRRMSESRPRFLLATGSRSFQQARKW